MPSIREGGSPGRAPVSKGLVAGLTLAASVSRGSA